MMNLVGSGLDRLSWAVNRFTTLDPVQFPSTHSTKAIMDPAEHDQEKRIEESAQNARGVLFTLLAGPETRLVRNCNQTTTIVV